MYVGFIDHGMWAAYIPDPVPEDAPKNALFAKRNSDGKDWYEHVHAGINFQPTSVKFTVAMSVAIPGSTVIKAPALDPTMLFPTNNMRVVEMQGDFSIYTVDELIDQYANKIIDLETGMITNPPPITIVPPPVVTADKLNSLLARIDKLEKKS